MLGYPLFIAISGLWDRVRLVWLTTALFRAGYAALAFHAVGRGSLTSRTKHQDPIAVIAVIAVTGYVIALQVERAGAALNANPRRGYDSLRDHGRSR